MTRREYRLLVLATYALTVDRLSYIDAARLNAVARRVAAERPDFDAEAFLEHMGDEEARQRAAARRP